MNGTLISCPKCTAEGKKPVLGRLLENGEVLVLRFHHGTTVISASDLYVKCGCGYAIHISQGSISNYQPVLT